MTTKINTQFKLGALVVTLADVIPKDVTKYIFSFIFVGAALSKLVANGGNEKNWPVILPFFWKLVALYEFLTVVALWALPNDAWVAIYMSYFIIGSIISFLAIIPDKQGDGGLPPLSRDGAKSLVGVIILCIVTNLLGFQQYYSLPDGRPNDYTRHRIFAFFAGLANALTVNHLSMMIRKATHLQNNPKKDI